MAEDIHDDPDERFVSVNESIHSVESIHHETSSFLVSLPIDQAVNHASYLCGTPLINLETANFTVSITQATFTSYFNPCGQVDLSQAPSCTAAAQYGDVMGCTFQRIHNSTVIYATAGPNHSHVKYRQFEVDQPASFTPGIEIMTDTGEPCPRATSHTSNDSSLPAVPANWSMSAMMFCDGEYDVPSIRSASSFQPCSWNITINAKQACPCGMPGFELYPETDHSNLVLKLDHVNDQGRNVTLLFSPCNTIAGGPCDDPRNATFRDGSRSILCEVDPELGTGYSWMRYTPDHMQWHLKIRDDVQYVSMNMVGTSSASSWDGSILIANYWCSNTTFGGIEFKNMSTTWIGRQPVTTIDLYTRLACFDGPLPYSSSSSSSSSSTGSPYSSSLFSSSSSSSSTGWPNLSSSSGSVEPESEYGATAAHAIVVFVLGVLLLLFIVVLCVRARRHVNRWAYVDRFEHYDVMSDDEPCQSESINQSVNRPFLSEVEIFDPQYRHIRAINQ